MDKDLRVAVIAIILAVILAGALGYYYATITATGSQPSTTVNLPSTEAGYHLDLVEPMDNGWNSTLAQPKFLVLTANGLESSGNITLPSKTLIRVMIVSYDTPTPGTAAQYGVVSGTVGSNMFLINSTIASMTNMTNMQWGQNVTSVPVSQIAHTFSIPSLNINILVVAGDTEIAYLYFNQKGTFQWLCYTPCGFGPNGAMGAMSKAGWMEGQITVT